ncbi:putative polyol transporter 4-like protein [Carex littledalei]|uniref:Putative polyol transporter 4-like protein n=1 Tax=Carex littledalei TaxID=544730 RepID=A0A833V3I6_9POAL|nr:putative polyol transporter 4-like protein [Carex littledalei]
MSGAIIYVKRDLHITEVQQEIFVGCLSIVSIIGSLIGGPTSDSIGRKWTMGIGALIFQAGAVVMTFAPSFTILMLGRLITGVGIGFGFSISAVYIAELSPAAARGTLVSVSEIFVNIGILLGYISNYAFSGLPQHINWRIMLGVGILPAFFIGITFYMIPESPRWLVMQNRLEEARSVLVKVSGKDEDVEQRLKDIQEAACVNSGYKKESSYREILFPSPAVRRMLAAGCGIMVFQQITGIDATVYYSPTILKNAGIKSEKKILATTVGVGFTKTVFILIAIFLIDKVGRKVLLYVSTIGMTVCLAMLGMALALQKHLLESGMQEFGIGLAIFAVCGNVAFFSIGLGPICWVLSSEIFSLRLRAKASALGQVGARVSSSLVSMSFLSLSRAMSVAGVFFLFSAISAVAVVFVKVCVPETKGKTLEEIEMALRGGEKLDQADVESVKTEQETETIT